MVRVNPAPRQCAQALWGTQQTGSRFRGANLVQSPKFPANCAGNSVAVPVCKALPVLWNGLQIGAAAGAGQHLDRPRLLLAIGQRGDRIVIQPVDPIALDIPDTDLTSLRSEERRVGKEGRSR